MITTFKINLKQLEKNYNEFKKWGEIYFPVKTNHNQIILNKLKRLGCGFECDCVEHIKKIYNKNNKEKIIFSNVSKMDEDIVWAIRHGIVFYTVDDKQTLIKIINLAKDKKFEKLKINVRLNVYDIFLEVFKKKGVVDSRLGAVVEKCKELLNIINKEKEVKIEKGISFYVQVEVHNEENVLEDVSKYIAKNFVEDFKLDWVNIGGGSTIKKLEKNKKVMFDEFAKIGVKKIILEPGRYLVDQVEDAIVPIRRAVLRGEGQTEMLVTLSVGIYHGLIDYKFHNRKFEYYIISNKFVKLTDYTQEKHKKLVLRGPTADSADMLGVFNVPKVRIDSKTLILIKNIGAYVEVNISSFSGNVPVRYEVLK